VGAAGAYLRRAGARHPAVSKITGKKKKTEKRKKYKLWVRRVLTKGGRAPGTRREQNNGKKGKMETGGQQQGRGWYILKAGGYQAPAVNKIIGVRAQPLLAYLTPVLGVPY